MKNLCYKIYVKRFLSYGINGGICALLTQSLYIALVYFGMKSGAATWLADLLPLPVSYFLNWKFTFKKKYTIKSLVLFPLCYLPGFVVNYVGVVFLGYILDSEEWFRLILLPISIISNFVFMNLFSKIESR